MYIMYTIEQLDKEGYKGIDASVEISLFEYGIAIKEIGESYNIIYGINQNDKRFNKFDQIFMKKDDINNFINNNDWIKKDEFFSYTGITEKNYQSLDILNKIYDLFQYYGAENIFGCNYDLGFEIDE